MRYDTHAGADGRADRRAERARIRREISAILSDPVKSGMTRRRMAKEIGCTHSKVTYYAHEWKRDNCSKVHQCKMCGQIERVDNPVNDLICLDCKMREQGEKYDWRVKHSLSNILIDTIVMGWGGISKLPQWVAVGLAPFLGGKRPMPATMIFRAKRE